MKILSTAGIAFPQLDADAMPPGPIASLVGIEVVPQEGDDDDDDAIVVMREGAFMQFAAFTKMSSDSLTKAMDAKFIRKILNSSNAVPSGKTLYEAIVDKYVTLQTAANGGTLAQITEFFEFRLYFYLTLVHFSIWTWKRLEEAGATNGSEENQTVIESYRTFVIGNIRETRFADNRLSPAALAGEPFASMFMVDGTLREMYDIVKSLTPGTGATSDLVKTYKNILTGNGKPARLTEGEALAFRIALVREFRLQCYAIIEQDVKQFLGRIFDQFPSPGLKIVQDYGDITQYVLGDGGETQAMFGTDNYGLLFMQYRLNAIDADPAARFIKDIPLLNRDERDCFVSLIYYGLNSDTFVGGAVAPSVRLTSFIGSKQQPENRDTHRFEAISVADHFFARNRRPWQTVRLSDLGDGVDSMQGSLHTTQDSGGVEEMMYVLFKHRMEDPGRNAADAIFVSTERQHLDNEFQQVVAPATAPGTAAVAPASFAQPTALAALAAALAADPGFGFDAVIEGLGIGALLAPADYGKGNRALKRAADQRDYPPAPGYDPLRHAYGWMEWFPGSSTPGWLTCHVTGFASPLRCTWAETLPAAQQAMLQTFFEDLVTRDAQDRPVYNCLLSAFRAFSLFHSMVTGLSGALDALGTPAAATAKQRLDTYLKTEAHVYVTLPTGMPMLPQPLRYASIEPFYFL